jgi:hypothetical protein
MGTLRFGFVYAVVLALRTVRATSFWTNDYTLFTRAHEIAPQNSAAQDNLSVALGYRI